MDIKELLSQFPPNSEDHKHYWKYLESVTGVERNVIRRRVDRWMKSNYNTKGKVHNIYDVFVNGHNPLVTVSETYNGDGELKHYTKRVKSREKVDTTGMEVKEVRVNSKGEQSILYKTPVGDSKGFTEDFLNQLADKLSKRVSPVKFEPTEPYGNDIKKVLISDIHVGALVEDDSIFNNEYNKTIVKNRLQSIVQQLYTDCHREDRYKCLTIIDLGDNLDGYEGRTTRGGHKLPQNMTSREQFDVFLEAMSEMWDSIISLNMADSYEYIAMSNDNHAGAFGWTAYKALEIYLNLKYPDIKTFISKKFIDHIEIGDETVIFTHGKDEHYKSKPLPLILDTRTENFILQYIDKHNLTGKINFYAGDQHRFAVTMGKKFGYFRVPSVFGSSGWIHCNFGYTRPGYCLQLNDKTPVLHWLA